MRRNLETDKKLQCLLESSVVIKSLPNGEIDYDDLEDSLRIIRMAEYAEARLREKWIAAWRNTDAIKVVFPRPAPAICKKWQLAVQEDIAHLITMPGVTKEKVDAFVNDNCGGS